MAARTFHWADYLVFILSLVLTAAIGVFFLIADFRKKKLNSTEIFLLGGRSMNFLPVALSMVASLLNGVFILGGGAEMHYFGTQFALLPVAIMIAALPTAFVFAPKFHDMGLTSAYEYMEKRFNVFVRVISSLIFIISVVLFLAVVLYTPALAFAQVTGLQFWVTIVITGLTCTLYCGIGGMKAVIWTDTIQMVILAAGLILVAVFGVLKIEEGSDYIWKNAKNNSRIIFDNTNPDPRERHSLWGLVIGQSFNYAGVMISNQMIVQRYLTVPNIAAIQKALFTSVVLVFITMALVVIIGLTMFAFYKCDPLIQQSIKKGDQIVALFVMDTIGHLHGLPGLFTASVFAAALSSVSSALNSLGAVFLEDIFKPAYMALANKKPSPKVSIIISRSVVVVFGLLTIGLSYAAEHMGSTLITVTPTIFSISSGPLAAVFCLGMFASYANGIGAAVGLLSGLGFGVWIAVCNVIYIPPATPATISMQCNRSVLMSFAALQKKIPVKTVPEGAIYQLYSVSYAWYALFCFIITILVGIIVSLLTCGIHDSKYVPSNLLYWAPCLKCSCYRCKAKPPEDDGATNAGFQGSYELDREPQKAAYDNPGLDADDIRF